jgi:uncharacterized protein (TIGR02147 family)
MESVGFRSLLRDELLARCKKNPLYSARALARDLRVSPAFLSQVLSGKRKLSEQRSYEISERLGWDSERRRVFTGLVRYDNAASAQTKETILEELHGVARTRELMIADLELDRFKVVADWHHMAIAELTQVEGFKASPRWIARRLGISAQEASAAIERLLRVGVLVEKDGALSKARVQTKVGDAPSEAIRTYHRQMLEKAIASLESQSPSERDVTGTTLVIDPKLLPKAREMIRELRWQLMGLLESGAKKKVYQLSVQLFRLEEQA